MTKRQKQKSAHKKSQTLNDVDPSFLEVYNTTTCAKCGKPVSKKRVSNCKRRKFFPICEECEKVVVPMLIKAKKKMTEAQDSYFK